MTTMNRRIGRVGQILPIYPNQSLELELSIKDHTYIKVVATGKYDELGRNYTPNAEYWRTRELADFGRFDRGIPLAMRVSSGAYTEDQIDKFFDGYQEVGCWDEAMPSWRWQRFSYTAPQIITPYLFSTPDFDVPDRPLGLSLLIDSQDQLQGVGWHKTSCPPNGYIWHEKTAPKHGDVVQFSLDGWTTDPWTVRSSSGTPMDSWWYAINLCR
jgi:hypothetical protein